MYIITCKTGRYQMDKGKKSFALYTGKQNQNVYITETEIKTSLTVYKHAALILWQNSCNLYIKSRKWSSCQSRVFILINIGCKISVFLTKTQLSDCSFSQQWHQLIMPEWHTEWQLAGKNTVRRVKNVPVPFYLPKMPREMSLRFNSGPCN